MNYEDGGHSARVFVVVYANWLAAPSQIGVHDHFLLGVQLDS
jgi:hypothetical protein